MPDRDSRAKLIHRYLDDSLNSTEERDLMASLERSSEARRQFVEEAFLTHDLREAMREADIRSFIVSGEGEVSAESADRLKTRPSRRVYSIALRGGLAAAVLIAVALWIPRAVSDKAARDKGVPDAAAIADRPSTEKMGQAESAKSVGTIVQQRECKWVEGSNSWRSGDLLPPRTLLSLESGAAEVALENGVRLVLSGPCEVQLVNEMRGRVFRGSLVAKVPSGAHGYTLTTPSSQVVDLGTEFGVAVDRSGKSEVHVFTGEVISRWSGADKGQGKPLRLHQNDGARYGLRKSDTTLITADETRFIRDLAPRLPLADLPPLPVRKNLALWLAADRMIETDASGGVQSWSDLLCDPSQTFQVALQLDPNARPHLVPDAMNGRPAVRFDGVDDYLVTTPLETTDSQTIFVVLGLNNMRATEGQIINYNGPPHRELSAFPTIPGVLHLSERRFSGGGFRLAGFVYPGGHNAEMAVGSHVRKTLLAGSPELKAPIAISFRYDPVANSAALHVNGKLVAQKSAPWPVGLTSRKVIGSHGAKDGFYLNADIAEIVIYNQALSDSELKSVFGYLAARYGDFSEKVDQKAN
ncbi:MAG TPA: FecR domain-containing protein [Lacipirellulaceae bacterium]|jgi:hypothetical protein|nr:FecR domain-containing protein [Lacipirellulaceae bacterium]